jgi:hypothetical protein
MLDIKRNRTRASTRLNRFGLILLGKTGAGIALVEIYNIK